MLRQSKKRVLNEHELIQLIGYTEGLSNSIVSPNPSLGSRITGYLKTLGQDSLAGIRRIAGIQDPNNPLANNHSMPKGSYTYTPTKSDEELEDPYSVFASLPDRKEIVLKKPLNRARNLRRAIERKERRYQDKVKKARENNAKRRNDALKAARDAQSDKDFWNGNGYTYNPSTSEKINTAAQNVKTALNPHIQKVKGALSTAYDRIGQSAYAYGIPLAQASAKKAIQTIGKPFKSGWDQIKGVYANVMNGDKLVDKNKSGVPYSESKLSNLLNTQVNKDKQLNEALGLLGAGALAYLGKKMYDRQNQQYAAQNNQPSYDFSNDDLRRAQEADYLQQKYGVDPLSEDPKELGQFLQSTFKNADPQDAALLSRWRQSSADTLRYLAQNEPKDSDIYQDAVFTLGNLRRQRISVPVSAEQKASASSGSPMKKTRTVTFDEALPKGLFTKDGTSIDSTLLNTLLQDPRYQDAAIRDPKTGRVFSNMMDFINFKQNAYKFSLSKLKAQRDAKNQDRKISKTYDNIGNAVSDYETYKKDLDQLQKNLSTGWFGNFMGKIFRKKSPYELDQNATDILKNIVGIKNLDYRSDSPSSRNQLLQAIKAYRDKFDKNGSIITIGINPTTKEPIRILKSDLESLVNSNDISSEVANQIIQANNMIKSTKGAYNSDEIKRNNNTLYSMIHNMIPENTRLGAYIRGRSFQPTTPRSAQPKTATGPNDPASHLTANEKRAAADVIARHNDANMKLRRQFRRRPQAENVALSQKPILSFFEEHLLFTYLNNTQNLTLVSENSGGTSQPTQSGASSTTGTDSAQTDATQKATPNPADVLKRARAARAYMSQSSQGQPQQSAIGAALANIYSGASRFAKTYQAQRNIAIAQDNKIDRTTGQSVYDTIMTILKQPIGPNEVKALYHVLSSNNVMLTANQLRLLNKNLIANNPYMISAANASAQGIQNAMAMNGIQLPGEQEPAEASPQPQAPANRDAKAYYTFHSSRNQDNIDNLFSRSWLNNNDEKSKKFSNKYQYNRQTGILTIKLGDGTSKQIEISKLDVPIIRFNNSANSIEVKTKNGEIKPIEDYLGAIPTPATQTSGAPDAQASGTPATQTSGAPTAQAPGAPAAQASGTSTAQASGASAAPASGAPTASASFNKKLKWLQTAFTSARRADDFEIKPAKDGSDSIQIYLKNLPDVDPITISDVNKIKGTKINGIDLARYIQFMNLKNHGEIRFDPPGNELYKDSKIIRNNRPYSINQLGIDPSKGLFVRKGKRITFISEIESPCLTFFDFLDKFSESVMQSRNEITPRNMYHLYLIGKLNKLIK